MYRQDQGQDKQKKQKTNFEIRINSEIKSEYLQFKVATWIVKCLELLPEFQECTIKSNKYVQI